jgi:hypothetical protein
MNANMADPVYVFTHVIMTICFLVVMIVSYKENLLKWMRKNLVFAH